MQQFPGSRSKVMDLHLGTIRSIVAHYNHHEALSSSHHYYPSFPSLIHYPLLSIYSLSTILHHFRTVLGHLFAIINRSMNCSLFVLCLLYSSAGDLVLAGLGSQDGLPMDTDNWVSCGTSMVHMLIPPGVLR